MAESSSTHSTSTRTTPPPPVYEEPQPNLFSNILAIVGFVILIVVVIWGLVHLASLSRTWFSSFFGKGSTTIEVTAPKNTTSGTAFTVSWKYSEPSAGTYAFLYQCQGGIQLQTPGTQGGMNSIPCGAAFTIPTTNKQVSITPLLSGSAAVDVPISIIFMQTATSSASTVRQAQGSATVHVLPGTGVTPPPVSQPITPPPSSIPNTSNTSNTGNSSPNTQTTRPRTPADLSVRIVSITTDGYGNGIATFDIGNLGGTSSGTYYFTANLPTQTGYAYASPAQASLAPGGHIVSTLNFTQAVPGIFSVSITKNDANNSNNYASQNVMPSSYGPYNYVQPYQAQYAAGSYPYGYQYSQNSYMYQQYPYTQYYPYAY